MILLMNVLFKIFCHILYKNNMEASEPKWNKSEIKLNQGGSNHFYVKRLLSIYHEAIENWLWSVTRPSIATVHQNHLLRCGLGQIAPVLLSRGLYSLDLNDGRLGTPTTCGGSWFHFSGIPFEKFCCRKLIWTVFGWLNISCQSERI